MFLSKTNFLDAFTLLKCLFNIAYLAHPGGQTEDLTTIQYNGRIREAYQGVPFHLLVLQALWGLAVPGGPAKTVTTNHVI